MNSNESPETILTRLAKLRLPAKVRAHMRAELSAYADLHAYPDAPARPAPAWWRFPQAFGRAAAFGALLLCIAGGSAAYASSAALPGDTLYPVKLYVSEPMQAALIPTAQGKAAWHAILAERRLEEASALAATGALDAATEAQISSNFALQVERSLAASDVLRAEGDAETALLAQSDLEARITAHGQILERVSQHVAVRNDIPQTARDTVGSVLALVHEREMRVARARRAAEDTLALAGSEAPQAASTPKAAPASVATMKAGTLDDSGAAPAQDAAAARIEAVEAARELEVSAILLKHAAFLSVLGTTTASTTATTTDAATTTPPGAPQEDADRSQN